MSNFEKNAMEIIKILKQTSAKLDYLRTRHELASK
jgi:hypothetical protein